MIWDELTEKIQLNNRCIGVIPSNKLISFNIEIPNIQRIRDDDKVKDIVAYQQAKLKQTGTCNFIGCINIHYCLENLQLYLVDGQHRFDAIKQLSQTINIPVLVEIVKVNTLTELKENYNIINKNTPLPEFPETIDKSIPERAANYYKQRYPEIWSKTARARRPHIFFNYFQEALGVLTERLNIESVSELQKIIDDHNVILSKAEYPDCSEKQLGKCKEIGLYFGLYNHISDEYRYEWVRDILNIEREPKPKSAKKSIPKKIREDAWNKHVGINKNEVLCLCCRTSKITAFTFHAGHVVSDARGGAITVDNIRPICSECNLSMGARDMREFVHTHYPDNIKKFDASAYSEPVKKPVWNTIFGKL